MLHVVIMAGGSGTRFWPMSRKNRPKQFLALTGEAPLLRITYERVVDLVPPERTWVVTAATTAEMTRELLPELPHGNVIGEPSARDTAACVGFAAHRLLHNDPDATCVVLPADHVIGDEARFRTAMAAGASHVERAGGLLTFGIRPAHPETGYGYLKLGEHCCVVDGEAIHRLDRFVEKPDLPTAESYVASGAYLWNSGMFAWQARSLLAEIELQLPRLAAGLEEISASLGTPRETAVIDQIYPTLQRISVDFGVMEGARTCWSMPVDFPWSDVGSWPALGELLDTDSGGNATRGKVLTIDANDNVLFSDGPLIALIGLDNLVAVATGDAILVAPLSQAQQVKQVVEKLREKGWDEVL
jgi:mannose-1-phosphate guanylyltransferase